VEATLREPWDPTNHIENLFQTVKEGTETLLQMEYVTSKTDCEKLFIKYAYAAIQKSGQFEKDCTKWKALPDKDKKTTKQSRTFFGMSYNICNTSYNSLALAGVANSVQQVAKYKSWNKQHAMGLSASVKDKKNKMRLMLDKMQSMVQYYRWWHQEVLMEWTIMPVYFLL
jgi:CII-binding regulator of phage lambda lysogenization HflD